MAKQKQKKYTSFEHYLEIFRLSVASPIMLNVIAINPNKFLAVFSFTMATTSMLVSFAIFTLNYLGLTSIAFVQIKNGINVDVSGWYVLTLALMFSVCFTFCLPLTLFLSRRDPRQYAQILSGGVKIGLLIKITSTETYRIVTQTNYYNDERALEKIQGLPNSFAIVSELTSIIAERLKVTHEVVKEHIFQFDPEIFINRQNQKFYNQATKFKNEEKGKRAKKVTKNLNEIENYLMSLKNSKLNFDHLEFMFQTRSVSSAMQHYIKFIEDYGDQLLAQPSDIGELALLRQVQKSYKDGAVNYRAIGQVLSQNAFGDLDELTALARLRCLSPNSGVWATYDKDICALTNWSEQSVNHVYNQREDIVEDFPERLKKIVDTSFLGLNKKSKTYIVLFDYSRAVRTALASIVTDDNYKIICLRHNDSKSDFGSRLMYQQITKEHPDDSVSRTDITKNVALVTFQQFYSEFDKKTDSIVYICGCDFIEDKKAYLFLSPKVAEKIKENTGVRKLNVIAIAGAYKYRIHDLAAKFKGSESSKEALIKVLPPKMN